MSQVRVLSPLPRSIPCLEGDTGRQRPALDTHPRALYSRSRARRRSRGSHEEGETAMGIAGSGSAPFEAPAAVPAGTRSTRGAPDGQAPTPGAAPVSLTDALMAAGWSTHARITLRWQGRF